MDEKKRADREKATGILSELIGFEKSWICQTLPVLRAVYRLFHLNQLMFNLVMGHQRNHRCFSNRGKLPRHLVRHRFHTRLRATNDWFVLSLAILDFGLFTIYRVDLFAPFFFSVFGGFRLHFILSSLCVNFN